MATATLTKVGNSMAVLLPKALRQEAAIDQDTPLRLASPRKGVVVITSMLDDEEDRLARLRRVEARIAARRNKIKPWPEGLTADDLIAQAKEERYRLPCSLTPTPSSTGYIPIHLFTRKRSALWRRHTSIEAQYALSPPL